MIGTLIETNERIIAALEMYDMAVSSLTPALSPLTKLYVHQLSKPDGTQEDVKNVQEGLAAAKIDDSELTKLQEKQRAAVDRVIRSGSIRGIYGEKVHPDLQDLNFGELGEDQRCVNRSPVFSPSG